MITGAKSLLVLAMCNEVARRIALNIIREDFSQLKIPLRFPEGLPNLAPLDSVRITDPTAIVRWREDADEVAGAELVQRQWSWKGPSGKPVYNYRSDGRELRNGDSGGRCLVPVDAFYEFTAPVPSPGEGRLGSGRAGVGSGELFGDAPNPPPLATRVAPPKGRGKKDKWAFTKTGEDWFCLAGLWRSSVAVKDGLGEAFTLLTTEPGPDVAPYHSRQVVVIERRDWGAWLDGSVAAGVVCVPLAAGVLSVRKS